MLGCSSVVFVRECRWSIGWWMEGVGGGGAGRIVFAGEPRVIVSSLRLSICVRIFVFILISLTALFVCIVSLRFYHYFQLEY